ncbi:glycerate kinase [Deinococcus lacus]|uniref:Glycerate kinase n=1 Tax=Deinococcus lacus TaxID=392561 RepID=A0ABW1YIF4_9DEIO
MRILIAPDSFKGSLSAYAVAGAIARGVKRACPEADTVCVPMADGGEGTLEVFIRSGLARRSLTVADPLGRPVTAYYAAGDNVAVVELAQASGLPLLEPTERNPRLSSTRGTGELLLAAAQELPAGGELLLCIGGSATNDAGSGLLSALGARFLDASGQELPAGGAALRRLDSIDLSGLLPHLSKLSIRVACDVDNPLLGPRGASTVFGPQKGAGAAEVAELEQALGQFADVVARQTGVQLHDLAGAGAAGGTAGGLHALLGASLEPGVRLVAQLSGLERRLTAEDWDLVWTGEGSLDMQSAHGKVVSGVCGLALQRQLPVIALCGRVAAGAVDAVAGLQAAFALANGPLSPAESQAQAADLLTLQAEQLTRLWQAGSARRA